MLFSLYNTKINVFKGLFEADSEEIAKRMFIQLLNSQQPNEITDYIDEYVLYCVGGFDKDSGRLSPLDPYSIMSGLEALKSHKERKATLDRLYAITPSPSGDEDKECLCQ